ncbi:alpha/beta hydrolase [uncultured Winogradskyella sp.]|uniref:alpha/beta hydrolase n=1 Tax=uncultured Winogradskyella sp. TaxID=395353 RepID=UPI0026174846|nr:alpha/beta hydrolase [uncultured Winogradskyella sp.]
MVSCSSDGENPMPPEMMEEIVPETLEAVTLNNVTYGSAEGQNYDIYLPENRTLDTKVVLLVHGGGWTSGDKADMVGFLELLKSQLPQVAIVNMNYRLADNETSPFPMQTDDITTLVAQLREKQTEYQISTNLGLLGVSAGGHLSLLWSYAYDTEEQVKMVCSIVGPTNFLDEAYLNSTDPAIQELIGLFGEDTELLEETSPLFQVKTTSPPTQLFYGGQDPLIPTSQGVDLDAKLTELNVLHEFTLYETEGHGWVGDNLFDTSIKLKAFIETHLLAN